VRLLDTSLVGTYKDNHGPKRVSYLQRSARLVPSGSSDTSRVATTDLSCGASYTLG
jgi:hypothetical protein